MLELLREEREREAKIVRDRNLLSEPLLRVEEMQRELEALREKNRRNKEALAAETASVRAEEVL